MSHCPLLSVAAMLEVHRMLFLHHRSGVSQAATRTIQVAIHTSITIFVQVPKVLYVRDALKIL